MSWKMGTSKPMFTSFVSNDGKTRGSTKIIKLNLSDGMAPILENNDYFTDDIVSLDL